MLSLFATPGWLLGLLGLPLLRWLHRGGRHRRALAVSHLGLWRGAAVSPPAAGARRPPDPAWRRRALLAGLLLLALAGPQGPAPRQRVTLWVDDGPSMLLHETRGTRLALALDQARAQLAALGAAEVTVRALGDPWQALGALDEGATAGLAAGAGRQLAAPPPAALLTGGHEHWLLSDGAHPELLDWPGGRRPDRLVQVGEIRRNVALERGAARRSPDQPDRLELLFTVANGGDAAETRELVVTGDGGELLRRALTLAAGERSAERALVPATSRLRAELRPGDALAQDDSLALDLALLRRRRVAVDEACPAAVRAALAAHPALAGVAANATDVDARLACASSGSAPARPTVWLRAELTPAAGHGAAQWSTALAAAQRIALPATLLARVARLQPGPQDKVLLAQGDEPLIVERGGTTPQVETALDFGALAAARDPALPLLLNLLFERVLGTPLLDAMVLVDRGRGAAQVVPATAPVAAAAAASEPAGGIAGKVAGDAPRGAGRSLAPPLLWAALAVLLWEIAALVRQGLRLRRAAPLGPA